MTKTLDIPQQTIDRARRITHAATDEEAIVLAIAALNDGGDERVEDSILPRPSATPLESLYTSEQLAERRQRQAEFVKHLGTSDGFMTVEELRAMRAMD